ncbi:NAD-dependent epimerase/dehydratase family protein [uncultured Algibacter sp.]|uniref:NAD-dependent epimerase/dehydratase family protein n=1 Tax=uncultured Algibacter sp. TaxID=298659 RepID=UPI002636C7A2|nr:NAD-dependent epimerase/dehydratase family protein [uncultured Algibacter sp.]
MRVFLTGATGYVGHQLALELANKNFTVHALIRNIESRNIPVHTNIKVFEGDICNYSSIRRAMKKCDFVFHTAAYTNLKCRNIDNFFNTNVFGTENVLKAAYMLDVKKVIYTSTLSVFGPSYKSIPIEEAQPRLASFTNDYELTKSMSEEKVMEYTKKGLPCIILNVTRVYGPGLKTFSNGVNRLISMIIKNNILLVPNNLKAASNYVFIGDVVDAHVLAMESDIKNAKYIIGGENIDYENLFQKIKIITKSSTKIVKINFSLVKTGLTILNAFRNLVGKSSLISVNMLQSLFMNRISTSKKAISELKYMPTSLQIGLMETINQL